MRTAMTQTVGLLVLAAMFGAAVAGEQARWTNLPPEYPDGLRQIIGDDLVAVDYAGEKLDTTGSVQVQMSTGVELAFVQVRPIPPSDGVFEPVTIDHSLNAVGTARPTRSPPSAAVPRAPQSVR